MVHEIWQDICGYEGYYQVSNLGRVKSLSRPIKARGNKDRNFVGRVLKEYKTPEGYLSVNLCVKNKGKTFLIHHLVAKTFIGDRPERLDINHKNGNKTDNRLGNLEYCTRSENILHAIKKGLIAKGEKHSNAKLTALQVSEIRELYTKKEFIQRELAKMYGVSQSVISDIINQKMWS